MAEDVILFPISQVDYPEIKTYSLEVQDPLVRTDIQGGPAAVRSVSSSLNTRATVLWTLEGEAIEIFEAWYKYKILEGDKWFTLPLFYNAQLEVVEARFVSRAAPKLKETPGTWMFSAVIELRDTPILTEAELDAVLAPVVGVQEWPSSVIPQALIAAYSIDYQDAIQRTAMESGTARRRRMSTNTYDMISVQWEINGVQKSILEAWYRYKIVNGSEFFTIDLFSGGSFQSMTARFASRNRFAAKDKPGLWGFSGVIEVRDRTGMSEATLDLKVPPPALPAFCVTGAVIGGITIQAYVPPLFPASAFAVAAVVATDTSVVEDKIIVMPAAAFGVAAVVATDTSVVEDKIIVSPAPASAIGGAVVGGIAIEVNIIIVAPAPASSVVGVVNGDISVVDDKIDVSPVAASSVAAVDSGVIDVVLSDILPASAFAIGGSLVTLIEIIDPPPPAKIFTVFGTAKQVTAKKKFGVSSGEFLANGASNYITTPAHSDFDFLLGDHTIDFWLWTTSFAPTSGGGLIGHYNAGTERIECGIRPGGGIAYTALGLGPFFITTLNSLVDVSGAWVHYEMSRASGIFRLFRDGNLELSGGNAAQSLAVKTLPFRIGSNDANFTEDHRPFYVDELRISSIARHTTSFTTETAAYTRDLNTKLLMHFDDGNLSTNFIDSVV